MKERKKYGNKQTEMEDSFCFVGFEAFTVLTMKSTASELNATQSGQGLTYQRKILPPTSGTISN
jgi:hypothetical protein